jgi:hypothetical protein
MFLVTSAYNLVLTFYQHKVLERSYDVYIPSKASGVITKNRTYNSDISFGSFFFTVIPSTYSYSQIGL